MHTPLITLLVVVLVIWLFLGYSGPRYATRPSYGPYGVPSIGGVILLLIVLALIGVI